MASWSSRGRCRLGAPGQHRRAPVQAAGWALNPGVVSQASGSCPSPYGRSTAGLCADELRGTAAAAASLGCWGGPRGRALSPAWAGRLSCASGPSASSTSSSPSSSPPRKCLGAPGRSAERAGGSRQENAEVTERPDDPAAHPRGVSGQRVHGCGGRQRGQDSRWGPQP